MSTPPAPAPGSPATCARHPDRPTYLACSRCRRPACPDCLREASVGQHCVDCVAEAVRSAPRTRGFDPARRPVVVPVLIAVNVVVFVVTVLLAGSVGRNDASTWFDAASLIPVDVAGGQFWRLVTSGFLHLGPLHLAFNMIALWVIGSDLERVIGHARFAALYAVSLLGGSTAVMLFAPPGGAVAGASGAVFGLMGGLVVLLRRAPVSSGPALAMVGINVVLSFVIPGLSLAAHLGGLVVGALATVASTRGRALRPAAAAYGATAAIAVGLLVAVAVRAVGLY